jgi:hypothetical protein
MLYSRKWILLALSLGISSGFAEDNAAPQRVTVRGYFTDAMEPFISKDGRFLLFNNSNDPRIDTNLQFATRIDDLTFQYGGSVKGANSALLDAVPSMDSNGLLYFVSTRDYQKTLGTVYRGRFDNGALFDVEELAGLSQKKLGRLNFDAEIAADGNTLFAVDGKFSGKPFPDTADIFIAVRDANGFRRLPNSDALLKNVNTSALEYAPAISANLLDLYFTRAARHSRRPPVMLRASRSSANEPFGAPQPLPSITGFVEAATLSSDGCSLYFHRKDGDRYSIYHVDTGACVPKTARAN